ncbi:MAG: polysaccharide biosynthesis protein [Anaerovoracaceae bacterium]
MSEEKGNKFVKGAAILAIAGVVIKLLGAVFRIPLTNLLGDDGMAYYGVSYAVYGVFLVLATAGIPVAISKLVSERIAIGNHKAAHKVFIVSFGLLFFIGLVSFLACYFGASVIAEFVGIPEAALSLKAIAPALFLVPMFSAFRGYFQGRQNMNPTAISEILEQGTRVIVGLSLSFFLIDKGLEQAAAGATFGASAGAMAGLGIIVMIYLLNRNIIHKKISMHNQDVEDTISILKRIIVIAVPIIIGAEIMPIMTTIDTGIIINRLQATGWTYEEAKSLYSQYSAYCNSLIAFPQVFTQAVAISLVPAISGFFRTKDMSKVHENINLGLRTTMIMAFPCAFGIFTLAEPILILLYPLQKASAIAAAPTLMIMAISVVFLAISQTTTGILQAIGKQTIPVKNLAIGAAIKVVVTYLLVGVVAINVRGAAIGTMVAYIITLVLNERAIRKYTDTTVEFNLTYVKPCIASLVMAVVVFATHRVLLGLAGNSIATLVGILVGVVVYGIMIFKIKAISKEELLLVPGGAKLWKIVNKFMK